MLAASFSILEKYQHLLIIGLFQQELATSNLLQLFQNSVWIPVSDSLEDIFFLATGSQGVNECKQR